MNTRVSEDEFAGQAVLVTGGASGMGWAACERFAARGAAILIADTDTVLGAARAADPLSTCSLCKKAKRSMWSCL